MNPRSSKPRRTAATPTSSRPSRKRESARSPGSEASTPTATTTAGSGLSRPLRSSIVSAVEAALSDKRQAARHRLLVRVWTVPTVPNYWLKTIGAADWPLADRWLEERPDLLTGVRAPAQPIGIHSGDRLVYYSAVSQKIFAIARATQDGDNVPMAPGRGEERWPYLIPVQILLAIPTLALAPSWDVFGFPEPRCASIPTSRSPPPPTHLAGRPSWNVRGLKQCSEDCQCWLRSWGFTTQQPRLRSWP